MTRSLLLLVALSVAACGSENESDDAADPLAADGAESVDTSARDSSDGGHGDVREADDGTNPLEGWPWAPTAPDCWRFSPESHEGVEVALNSPLATDGRTIYVVSTTSTSHEPVLTFLEAIDGEGRGLGRVEVWDMDWALPPMLDDDGNILLVGQAMSVRGSFRGVRVQKFSPDLVKVWESLWDPLESTCRHASLSIL